MLNFRAIAASLLVAPMLASPALASGTATPAPPKAPTVDMAPFGASAVQRSINNDDTPHQVELRLLTDRVKAKAGETVRVGVQLMQDEGWHTYWKNNPEVGEPTVIDWKVPDGATVTDFEFPVPQRFELESIVSYGYDDQTLFFADVTLPADVPTGPLVLGADVGWLTCEVQCIPGKGSVELTIEIVDQEVQAADAKAAALFEHYAKQHPAEPQGVAGAFVIESTLEPAYMLPDQEFTATYVVTPQGESVLGDHVAIGADSWPTVLPLFDKDAIWMNSIDVERLDSGQMKIVMKGVAFEVDELHEMVVGGLFQLIVDGEVVQTEFTVPMPWHESVIEAHAAKVEAMPDETAATPLGSPFVDDAACAVMLGGSAADVEVDDSWMTVLFMLGGAFLGGLILNIMPCVLPVLTLKVYGLIEQKDEGARNRIIQGTAYTAGILASFLALAAAVLVVKVVLGQNIGWGFQFQYPGYVATLAAIVFAFGLSLFGVFEIPVMGANAAAGAGSKEGPLGFFMTGVFATLLATPCSAPFLGSAMGFAFSQPPLVIVAFFLLVGLGLASPFLLIAFVPAMSRVLPAPGAWMDTFKQLMGFTLVSTTMRLVYVLSAQVSLGATLGYVAFLAVLGLGCWIFGHFGGVASSMGRQLGAFAAAAVVVVIGGLLLLDFGSTTELSALFEMPPLALGAVIVLLVTAAMVLFGVVPIPGLPVAEHGPSPAGTGMHVGGLALMGVAAALLFVFAPMTSPVATLGLIGFTATFTAGVWFVGHFSTGSTLWRVVGVISAVVVVGLGGWYFDVLNPAQASLEGHSVEGGIQWQDYSDDRMASVLGRYREGERDVYYEGKTLFIDFTAEWCLSCKVNEKTIIQTQTVQDAMEDLDVVPLKADWTNHNENITSWLGCYKRAGVPYYVVIPADPNQPAIALGEAVTPGSIVAGLRKGAGVEITE